jgi:lycopene cyclase domain-containing protein
VESLNYLGVIALMTVPVLGLEWVVGWRTLWIERRALLFALIISTLYLGLASIVAVRDDIWLFDEDKLAGLHGGGFVLEQWLLLLLANLIIVQAVILAMDEDFRREVRRALRRR